MADANTSRTRSAIYRMLQRPSAALVSAEPACDRAVAIDFREVIKSD